MRGFGCHPAAVAALLLLALPTAEAAASGRIDALAPVLMEGRVEAHGLPADLFLLGGEAAPFTFSLEAESILLVRHYTKYVGVLNPATGTSLAGFDTGTECKTPASGCRSVDVLSDVRVRSGAQGDAASLFAKPVAAGAASLSLVGDGGLVLGPADGYVVSSYPDPGRVRVGQGGPLWIHEEAQGRTIRSDAQGPEATITGDFILKLWDVAYAVESAEMRGEFVTGYSRIQETSAAGAYDVENATLFIRGGVLQLSPGGATLQAFAPSLTLGLDGSLQVPGAVGRIESGDSVITFDGAPARLDGAFEAVVTLNPDAAERLAIGLAGELRESSISAQSLPVLSTTRGKFAVGGFSALGLLALGAVLVQRARSARARVQPHAFAPGRSPDALLEEGVDEMSRGEFGRAARLFEGALALRSDDVALLINRGYCLERLGRLEDARRSFERAVIVAPGNAEAHLYYARILARLGIVPSALAHCSRSLAMDPRLAEMARRDEGFRSLRDHPQFLALVGAVA